MINKISLPPGLIKWGAIALSIGFISWAGAEIADSKYRAETMSSAVEAWSKALVSCIESGQDNCDERYRMRVR